jgi:RNA polymerase sigma-70 factor (ECF subfamily)
MAFQKRAGSVLALDSGGSELISSGAAILQTTPALDERPKLTLVSAQLAEESVLLALVRRIQDGDTTAFDRLYYLTREDAARALRQWVGQCTEVADLLQETYLRLLSAVKGFRGESRFRTFLYRICANVALSHLRWKRRRLEDPVATPPEVQAPGEDPEREAARRQAARMVEQALERLKPKKRIVFVYYELWEMSPDEIAEAVGSPVNTVRSRLHHARLEFTEAMHRQLDRPRARALHGAP